MVYPVTYPGCTAGKMGKLEKWGKMGENGGKWGKMVGNGFATGPRRPGMAWVGTQGAYYPLNHRWGCHPLPRIRASFCASAGSNDTPSSKIKKSPRRRPSGRPSASFPCMSRSDAVIFFILFDLTARPSSLENHEGVTHFLAGWVRTFTGTYLIPLWVTMCSIVAMRGEGRAQYPNPPPTTVDNVLERSKAKE